MGLIAWTRAEVLHLAWKLGRYTPPDRRVLEREILPALAADPKNESVLFVGVQWYTARYPEIFEPRDRLSTIDMKPELAEFGAANHVVGDVCELEKAFPDKTFDAIVMNGVIGFGLNAPDGIDRALAACAKKLRAGGILILGINENKPTYVDPKSVASAGLFEPCCLGKWDERVEVEVPFRERSHTFLFWRKRS
jgi:hypothetical protein